MPAAELVATLHRTATAIRAALDSLDDWGLAGTSAWQYRHDVAADAVGVEVLLDAGYGVLSEESGLHEADRPVVVVLDPVDGSTNASRGLPWYATSLCAVDATGALAAVVVNQATGTRYEAVRGGGARKDGVAIRPSTTEHLEDGILATSGWPPEDLGWSQLRCLGAAALDLCAVASGAVDAFVDFGGKPLAPWDYLGGVLVCWEAGAAAADAGGQDLVTLDPTAGRRILAAATDRLLQDVLRRSGRP